MLKLFDKLLFLVSVPKCVGCGERISYGELALCAKCQSAYQQVKDRNCSRCSKILSKCGCSNMFLTSHYTRNVAKVFRYFSHDNNRIENKLIYSLKKDNRSDVVEFLTMELASSISCVVENPAECVFVNVPRRKSAVREFGVDHAASLAKSLAKRFGARYENILVSRSKQAQKTKHGLIERYQNINFDYRRRVDLHNKCVIIVDDIITTGASVGQAAVLLHGLGAKKICAAAVAIAYRED